MANIFAEKCLLYVFMYMEAMYRKYNVQFIPVKLKVSILADNAFYSHGHLTRDHKQKFLKFDVPLNRAPKTGLGSSAAFTVSFVGALISVLEPEYVDVKTDVERIHNLAQIAHCEAQGKVGSGFDIASACFGSCSYSRFSPILAKGQTDYDRLIEVVHKKWDCSIEDFCLPSRLKLIMIDIRSGSSSPKLTQEFLKWREANVFSCLSKLNEMRKIIEYIREDFLELNAANKKIDAVWSTLEMKALNGRYEGILHRIRQSLRMLREYYAHLGDLIGIPIIPRVFQPLIVALEGVHGVLCVGAPGAGGFDALFCIMINHSVMIERISGPIRQYFKDAQQQPGMSIYADVLEVETTSHGIQAEKIETFGRYFDGSSYH